MAEVTEADWARLREAATAVMARAYAPYSSFKVGAAGLVDDGRVVAGCNVENAAYGVGLCAECGLVSALHAGGGGRLVAVACVDGHGNALMPCGRCRQLLWENGGPDMLLETVSGIRPMTEVLPDAFGPDDLTVAPMSEHDAVDVIPTKRDGKALSDEQIDWVIDAYTRGEVADEQMSALAMAILLNGMDRREISRWTDAMIASGERMSFPPSCSAAGRPPTSTPPAASATRSPCRWRRWWRPAVRRCRSCPAAASATPAARWTSSSRSPAGGPRCPASEFLAQLGDVGAVICAASDDLAPADKKLYALRDVTGTVEAIPLIASSIMSKKIAEGTGALVLDVKVGSGAFMKDVEHGPRAGRRRWSRWAPTTACAPWPCSPTWPPRSG